jgi:hypothetical protein
MAISDTAAFVTYTIQPILKGDDILVDCGEDYIERQGSCSHDTCTEI